MLKHLFVCAISALSLIFVIGCGDKSTGPDGGGGSANLNENAGALVDHPGTNTPIKDTNTAKTVGATVQSQSTTAMSKAMSQMKMSKSQATSYSGNIDGTFNGTSSGTATAKGTYSMDQSGNFDYNIVCTFSNYSDDGKLYLGGQIHYDLSVNTSTNSGTYLITGKIRFNGSYVGTNNFTYDCNLTAKTYKYTSTIVSDGVTTTVSMN